MRKLTTALAALAVLTLPALASAEVIFSEDFNSMSAGAFAPTATEWSTYGGAGNLGLNTIVDDGTGNMVLQLEGTGNDPTFSSPFVKVGDMVGENDSVTITVEFKLYTDSTYGSPAWACAIVGDGTGSSNIWTKNTGRFLSQPYGRLVGGNATSAGALATLAAEPATHGWHDYMMVITASKTDAAGYDFVGTTALYFDGVLMDADSAADEFANGTTGDNGDGLINWLVEDGNQLDTFAIMYAGGASVEGKFKVDDLVISVVPEPATMALLGLGSIGVLVRRKRK